MMLLLGIWHNNYNLRYVSTTHVQFTFSAGTVFVLSAIQAISGPRLGRVTLASSLSHVETCLEYLSIIGRSWETAEIAREILLNFFDETLKPRLLLRGGDANLKFGLDNVDKRARARANSNGSPIRQKDGVGDEPSGFTGMPASAASLGSRCALGGELHYFPGSPTLSTLGWPILNGGKGTAEFFANAHSNVSSPTTTTTVDHVSFVQHPHPHSHSQSHTFPSSSSTVSADMDLDGVGYNFGMNMNMVDEIVSAGGRGSGAANGSGGGGGGGGAGGGLGQPGAADLMAFGVPELGVGYQFDPHVHANVALGLSAEELAIMDQIVRQQNGNMVGQSVG